MAAVAAGIDLAALAAVEVGDADGGLGQALERSFALFVLAAAAGAAAELVGEQFHVFAAQRAQDNFALARDAPSLAWRQSQCSRQSARLMEIDVLLPLRERSKGSAGHEGPVQIGRNSVLAHIRPRHHVVTW